MKNEIKILIAVIVVILIILVGAYALKGSNNPTPSVTPTPQPVITPTPTPTPTIEPTIAPTITPTPAATIPPWVDEHVVPGTPYTPPAFTATATPSLPHANWGTGHYDGPLPAHGVPFFDMSWSDTGPIISWLWNFGDGTTSNMENPLHVFPSSGYYTVSLTVTNAAGSNTGTGHVLAN